MTLRVGLIIRTRGPSVSSEHDIENGLSPVLEADADVKVKQEDGDAVPSVEDKETSDKAEPADVLAK